MTMPPRSPAGRRLSLSLVLPLPLLLLPGTAGDSAWGPEAPRAATLQEPVRLRLMEAGPLGDTGYIVEFSQVLEIPSRDGSESTTDLTREARIRYRFRDARPAAGDSVSAIVILDSIRGAATTPHGRQVLGMRTLVGARLALRYSRVGGRPRYQEAPPATEFGLLDAGGTIAEVLDHAFPPMPTQAVRPGEAWEQTWIRSETSGMTVRERQVTARFTLVAVERSHGAQVARIEFVTRDARSAAAGGLATGGDVSQLRASRGVLRLGVSDGAIYELSLEEEISGSGDMFGGRGPYGQRTRFQLRPAGAATPDRD